MPGAGSPWGDHDDHALLAAHVRGEPDAFGELFARHRDRLWAVALRTMGNPDDAADGLQDALIAAYRRAETFRGDCAVTTWLHRVVVNACLDRLRALNVRRAEPLPDDVEEYARAGRDRPAPLDPSVATEVSEQRGLVLRALRELPDEQRAAIVLVDLEGHSVAEVAEMLQCAPGTVKSRCSRGRARLARLLAPLLEEADGGPGATPARNPQSARAVPPTQPRAPPAG
ncbi:RNA polymerase sigma factor SigM [Nocardioides sp. CBS4Y-1]|uniref:RNA polymerase sigma factor SigM n=1 Tax=Nocardioides acrostichi TaxID=2784339 RepID=A0A930V1D8_9ACTN|nr:RNA polymerase sigma factor SigM [Nocardioides acrostichi]